jgi:hypothetical protein
MGRRAAALRKLLRGVKVMFKKLGIIIMDDKFKDPATKLKNKVIRNNNNNNNNNNNIGLTCQLL